MGFGCVMSHHHIEGLCTFLFKFWRENSKWSSCPTISLTIAFPVSKIADPGVMVFTVPGERRIHRGWSGTYEEQ